MAQQRVSAQKQQGEGGTPDLFARQELMKPDRRTSSAISIIQKHTPTAGSKDRRCRARSRRAQVSDIIYFNLIIISILDFLLAQNKPLLHLHRS
jgi:hypothetical protein